MCNMNVSVDNALRWVSEVSEAGNEPPKMRSAICASSQPCFFEMHLVERCPQVWKLLLLAKHLQKIVAVSI